ncbi:MAG: asparagine synthase (glutamine-hydrolyzing), partial [Pseudomonadota bacterium]
MCGIGGILLGGQPSAAECEQATQAALTIKSALIHRGPDAQGSFTNQDGTTHLVHTRLSIIDLSEAASQPFASSCGRFQIVLNGEIYNYVELRSELIELGYSFRTESDTEVLLAAYQQWQESCVNKLRGMFAFLIWDNQENLAFAARDVFGIKPFYYAHSETKKELRFASELRALVDSSEDYLEVDAVGVYGYLRSGSVPEPMTLIKQITQLPAAHYLVFKDGTLSAHRYWDFPKTTHGSNRSEAVKALRLALTDTIAAHFVADVPVGIFLSGGTDSTVVLALAHEYYQQRGLVDRIRTYSIAFEDPEWNEGDIAAQTAAHFGTDHTQWVITQGEALSMFNDYCQASDQPSIDGFNTYCVSKLAKDNGEKVVLSGLGGDELFAGYQSFKQIPRLRLLARLMLPLWPFVYVVDKFLALRNLTSPKGQRVLDVLLNPLSKLAPYSSFRAIFSRREATSLTNTLLKNDVSASLARKFENRSNHTRHDQHELEYYMRNQLLRDSDVMSMRWGLELRVPFVDRLFYEKVSALPSQYRLEFGKQLLLDAVPELPQWVVEQPKRGFRFPFEIWFAQYWQDA